jgi:hypothetical protein
MDYYFWVIIIIDTLLSLIIISVMSCHQRDYY